MSPKWATFGVDLHLDLTSRGVRAALESALREAVRTGRLRPDTHLPSSRGLALDLGVARNTVADAYDQLVAEGWLVARRGSGTRVADVSPAIGPLARPLIESNRRFRYDLRVGFPDLSSFPRAAWLRAARRALNTASYEAFGYCDPRGRHELRTSLVEYLARTRGVRVTNDRLIVCAGFAEVLELLCQWLRANGATTLAIEEVGLRIHRATALNAGLRLQDLRLDAEGAAISGLGDANAVLLTPAHQFPLGVALSSRRRSAAVAWAVERQRLVIEDDYDGEFRYDRQPLGAMQALAPEHVVYVGTASKALAPGLRLAWMALPARMVDEIVAIKTRNSRLGSSLDQLALAEFIASTEYDRHVRRSRVVYRRRRDRLVSALQRRAPTFQVTGIAAGLHAVIELPEGDQEKEIVDRAAEIGLAVQGLHDYINETQRYRQALVVGYGTPPEHGFGSALSRLMAVLSK